MPSLCGAVVVLIIAVRLWCSKHATSLINWVTFAVEGSRINMDWRSMSELTMMHIMTVNPRKQNQVNMNCSANLDQFLRQKDNDCFTPLEQKAVMKLNDNVTKCSSLSKPAQNDEQKNGKHSSQESDANNKCDVAGS